MADTAHLRYNQLVDKIEVNKLDELPDGKFEITVRGHAVTKHQITLTQEYYQQLTCGAVSAEELIDESFELLLARESNTSILSEFDLRVIRDTSLNTSGK